MIARAFGALITVLHKLGYLPSVPHFVAIVFGVCQALIIVAVARYPHLLPPGYYKAIVRWSMYYDEEKLDVYMRRPSADFIPCSALLHEASCHAHAWRDLVAGMSHYSKLYAGIYGLSLLVFNPTSLLASPVMSVTQLLKKTLVSSAFFALDGTIVKYGICLMRNMWRRGPPIPHFIPALAGIVGGLTILFERPSRRLELVYYVMPQVLEAVWRFCTKKAHGIVKIPWGSVWLQCLSLATIMYVYEREKDSVSPLVHKTLQFLLGSQ